MRRDLTHLGLQLIYRDGMGGHRLVESLSIFLHFLQNFIGPFNLVDNTWEHISPATLEYLGFRRSFGETYLSFSPSLSFQVEIHFLKNVVKLALWIKNYFIGPFNLVDNMWEQYMFQIQLGSMNVVKLVIGIEIMD